MIFINKVNDPDVQKACFLVEKHYRDPEFLSRIARNTYNYTVDSGLDIADKISTDLVGMAINVVPYKTWNPFSKVIGYAEGNTIYVNTRKKLPVLDRAENLFHETMHLIEYSHKGNTVNLYNLETVPYKAARLFKYYLKGIYEAI